MGLSVKFRKIRNYSIIFSLGLFNTAGKFLPNPDEKGSSQLPVNPHRKLSSTLNNVDQQQQGVATKLDTLVTKSTIQSATPDNLSKTGGYSIQDLVIKKASVTATTTIAKKTAAKKSPAKKVTNAKTFEWVKTRNMSHYILPTGINCKICKIEVYFLKYNFKSNFIYK